MARKMLLGRYLLWKFIEEDQCSPSAFQSRHRLDQYRAIRGSGTAWWMQCLVLSASKTVAAPAVSSIDALAMTEMASLCGAGVRAGHVRPGLERAGNHPTGRAS